MGAQRCQQCKGIKAKPPMMSRRHKSRCGRCEQCNRPDCGVCLPCKDKVKFGGTGRTRQVCISKRCAHKTVKNMPDAKQPTIDAIYKKTLYITLSDSDAESEARLGNRKATKVAKCTPDP